MISLPRCCSAVAVAPTVDREVARKAKRSLYARFRGAPWFRGVGIAPVEGGLALRLNVERVPEDLPSDWEGIPLQVVEIAEYKPR